MGSWAVGSGRKRRSPEPFLPDCRLPANPRPYRGGKAARAIICFLLMCGRFAVRGVLRSGGPRDQERFQERMLMAAAKAWKFQPALRNGQPVRYRIRIPIILSDKP